MVKGIDAVIRQLIQRNNNSINISVPAVVVGVDDLKDGFIDVKPIVNFKDSVQSIPAEYPTLYNVRAVFPSTKLSTICFPVNQGDFVYLLFQSAGIQNFVSGNTEHHESIYMHFGDLSNVIAVVGFSPYQDSCFNPSNYTQDFDNQDLNIVHNKGTDNEVAFKLTTDGDVKITNAKKISFDCQEFEVTASEKIKFTAPLISENGR